jgi:hypothetical protein
MISFGVNRQRVNLDVDPSTPLLWVLRENLGLTGTKYGCGIALRRPHPSRVCPDFHHSARRIQCLKEFCNVLRRRPQLSFRQRFSLQTQDAIMAPSVSQIYSHRQTVEIGAKPISRILFSCPPGYLHGQLFPCFPTNSASTSFASVCTGPRDFARFDVGSLFFAELLCFKVDLLIPL